MTFGYYINALVSIGLCAFICESIVTNKVLSKALGLITGLCVFTVVISPIISFAVKGNIKEIFDTSKYENTYNQTTTDFTNLIEKDMEDRLSQSIKDQLGLQISDVSIDFTIKDDKAFIESVCVVLDTQDKSENELVREYLYGIFGNETNISVTEKTQ